MFTGADAGKKGLIKDLESAIGTARRPCHRVVGWVLLVVDEPESLAVVWSGHGRYQVS